MQSILLSIVIPVYKVERYIAKCLDSVMSQLMSSSDVEVIIVNDGTPDSSMDIVDRYVGHPNLKIINQVNQGLSAARNTGIRSAIGDYIWCIDSDDWVYSDSIPRVLDAIKRCHPDIIASLITQVQESDGSEVTEKYIKYVKAGTTISGKDYLFDCCANSPTQRFVIRRNLIKENNLEYCPGILHEDLEYCPRALYLADKVFLLESPIYYYLVRTVGSITSAFGMRHFECLYVIYQHLIHFRAKVTSQDIRYWKAYEARHLSLMLRRMVSVIHETKDIRFVDQLGEYLPTIRRNYHHILYSKHMHKSYIKMALIVRLPLKMIVKLLS